MVSAVVFPGQGSQSLGMLAAYAAHHQVADTVWEVSDAIDVDLADIIANDGDALNRTVNTQPAMLAVGVGVYRAARESGGLPPPDFFAGHSLGEYSALVCGGALALHDAARLVAQRAALMQNAVEAGAMAAILGLPAVTVEQICADLRETTDAAVWAANYNSETQVVIAGLRPSVLTAIDALKAAGAKWAVLLPMSVPSHCPLLQPAADALLPLLRAAEWRAPAADVLHTAAVDAKDTTATEWRCQTMAAQLVQPVNWMNILQHLRSAGVDCVYEVGPGKVLTNLGKKSGIPHVALDGDAALAALAASPSSPSPTEA